LRARARDTAGKRIADPGRDRAGRGGHFATARVLHQPAAGSQIVEGLKGTVSVDATDNIEVASVALSLNGSLLTTLPAAPYVYTYRTAKGWAEQDLNVHCGRDGQFRKHRSASRTLHVVADEPPAVALQPPTKLIGGLPATLMASASDDVAVTQVSFLVGVDGASPER
jgi:hypothetical protein